MRPQNDFFIAKVATLHHNFVSAGVCRFCSVASVILCLYLRIRIEQRAYHSSTGKPPAQRTPSIGEEYKRSCPNGREQSHQRVGDSYALESSFNCTSFHLTSGTSWHRISAVAEVGKLPSTFCSSRGLRVESRCMALKLNGAKCFVTSHPSWAIVGIGKCGTSFLYWFASHLLITTKWKENCLKNEDQVLDWISTSSRNHPWLGGCISPSFWLKLESIVAPRDVGYLMTIRHVSTLSWAAFNFWNLPMDRDTNKGMWAGIESNYRSSELFHELVLSRGKIAFPVGKTSQAGRLVWNSTEQSVQIASGFETLETFVSRNLSIFVLQSESFQYRRFMTAVASRLSGMHPSCINSTFVDEMVALRVNSGHSSESRGAQSVSPNTLIPFGVYEISNYLPMLPKTCKFLVDAWRPNCYKVNKLLIKSLIKLGISAYRDFTYDCKSLKYCNVPRPHQK